MCANRIQRETGARHPGKSDALDSERIARETLAHPLSPSALKRAEQNRGPDELQQLLGLWHNRCRWIVTSNRQLLNEAEHLLCQPALELREQLPTAGRCVPGCVLCSVATDAGAAPTRLRLQLLDGSYKQIHALDCEEKKVVAHLHALARRSGSTLGERLREAETRR